MTTTPQAAVPVVAVIPCKFVATPYETLNGRPVSRCSRPGCDAVLFNAPTLCAAMCRAPQFNGGEMVAALAKKVGITEKPGCGCRGRRDRWNRKFSYPLPAFVHKLLVLARRLRGWWKSQPYVPPRSRIDRLLEAGKIRPR